MMSRKNRADTGIFSLLIAAVATQTKIVLLSINWQVK